MIRDISALIFDLDGTLLDTKPDIAAALNRALSACGLPQRRLEDFNRIIGGGIRDAIRRAAPPGTGEGALDEIHRLYQADYPSNCCVRTAVYPGVAALLGTLARRGTRLAVITNKTESTSKTIVGHYFPEIPFVFVWGNDGVRPLKPAPDAGRLACEALGLEPGRVAYIGDSGSDMAFANAVGMVSAGAAWGYRGSEELRDAGAAVLLNRPLELL